MALLISFRCVNCWACVPECPEHAIVATEPVFHIEQQACNECQGINIPKCVIVCPVGSAITDQYGQAVLKGIGPFDDESVKLKESNLGTDELRLYEEWMY